MASFIRNSLLNYAHAYFVSLVSLCYFATNLQVIAGYDNGLDSAQSTNFTVPNYTEQVLLPLLLVIVVLLLLLLPVIIAEHRAISLPNKSDSHTVHEIRCGDLRMTV